MAEPMVSGYVWWCGDDYCDCRQAIISRCTPRQVQMPGGHFLTVWDETILWKGAFHTDGEGDPESELAAAKQYLDALPPAPPLAQEESE